MVFDADCYQLVKHSSFPSKILKNEFLLHFSLFHKFQVFWEIIMTIKKMILLTLMVFRYHKDLQQQRKKYLHME